MNDVPAERVDAQGRVRVNRVPTPLSRDTGVKARRLAEPASDTGFAQHAPRKTRLEPEDGPTYPLTAFAGYPPSQSQTHSATFPDMSWRPSALAASGLTSWVREPALERYYSYAPTVAWSVESPQ